jgi:hypothetical protein
VADALGIGGSRLQSTLNLGGYAVPLGWTSNVKTAPSETWRIVGPHALFVPGGAKVPVESDDLTTLIVDAKFTTLQAPVTTNTVTQEVIRLLTDIMPVQVDTAVVDVPVPTTMTYSLDRMAAVQDLLAVINCTHRMTADGLLEIYPLGVTAPVWTIQGGPGGALVSVNRLQDRSQLYNAVAASGTTTAGAELVGQAALTNGPMAFAGPFGNKPKTVTSSAITTQAAADAYAKNVLNSQVIAQSVDIPVICLPNFAVQLGDYVTVYQPTATGAQPLNGLVVKMGVSGSQNGLDPMTLTVRCLISDVETVSRIIRKLK